MTNPKVVEKLEALISSGDEADRCYAIQSLVTLRHRGANELLVQCLHDGDIDVCVDAANALAQLGDRNISDKLIDSLLNDPDGEVKTACIGALGSLGEEKAIPHLLDIIEQRPEDIAFNPNDWDFWWDMQIESIRAMGNMRVVKAVPVLERLINSGDYIDLEDEIFKVLVQIGDEGVDLLLKLMDGDNARIRRRLVRALAGNKSKVVFKTVARALNDRDSAVREAALNSLAENPHAAHYLPIILHLFNDQDAAVRATAVKLARQLSETVSGQAQSEYVSLQEKLPPLLSDPDPRVKTTVLETMLNLGWVPDDNAAEQLIKLLGECKGDCFDVLCRFIAHHHLDAAAADLLLLCRRNKLGNEEQARALKTLGELGAWNHEIELLLGAAIYDEHKRVRLAALETLAELHGTLVPEKRPGGEAVRMPVDLINDALRGNLSPPFSKRDIPVKVIDPVETAEVGSTAREASPEFRFEDTGEDDYVTQAMAQISTSLERGETPVPLSTLDSIAISCVENENKQAPQTGLGDDRQFTLSEQDQVELAPFLEITRDNKEIAKWLFNKEVVPVELDIQRLAARIMGRIGSLDTLPALFGAFDQPDNEFRREAILAIGEIASVSPLSSEDSVRFHHELIKALDSTNRDLRIAAVRMLGDLGKSDDIAILRNRLADREVSVRIHTIEALGKLLSRLEHTELASLLDHLLDHLNEDEPGIQRAVATVIPPLLNSMGEEAEPLKRRTIEQFIDRCVKSSGGQLKVYTQGMARLDMTLATVQLVEKLDALASSTERRFAVQMLAELHRPKTLH